MAAEGHEMNDDALKDLPKPQFKEIGALYEAAVRADVAPGQLNRERADHLMRDLARTTWKDQHPAIYRQWSAGGDTWNQLIKDVKSYSGQVNQHRRAVKKSKNVPSS